MPKKRYSYISCTRMYLYDLDKIHKGQSIVKLIRNSSTRCIQIYNVSRRYSLAEQAISKRTNMLYFEQNPEMIYSGKERQFGHDGVAANDIVVNWPHSSSRYPRTGTKARKQKLRPAAFRAATSSKRGIIRPNGMLICFHETRARLSRNKCTIRFRDTRSNLNQTRRSFFFARLNLFRGKSFAPLSTVEWNPGKRGFRDEIPFSFSFRIINFVRANRNLI